MPDPTPETVAEACERVKITEDELAQILDAVERERPDTPIALYDPYDQIRGCIGLLNSMVLSGENHSPKSEAVVAAAFALLPLRVVPAPVLNPTPQQRALTRAWRSAEQLAAAQGLELHTDAGGFPVLVVPRSYHPVRPEESPVPGQTGPAESPRPLLDIAAGGPFPCVSTGLHQWGIAPTTDTPCADCGLKPGGAGVVHACDLCKIPISKAGSRHYRGDRYLGCSHFRCGPIDRSKESEPSDSGPALPVLCAKLNSDLHDLRCALGAAGGYYDLVRDLLQIAETNARFAYRAACAAETVEFHKKRPLND